MQSATNTIDTTQLKNWVCQSRLRHVAVIMDGNRRWAKAQGKPTLLGHQAGVQTLKTLVRHCGEIGIEAITVYAFSTENWQRAQQEVGYLMELFASALIEETQGMRENNVRLKFIGDLKNLPNGLQAHIAKAEAALADNTGILFQIAANYGSRLELLRAFQHLAEEVKTGVLDPQVISEADIERCLMTAGSPPLDLLIRTGGESRLSNYLLWQAAYAEFYVSDLMWPDFTPAAFNSALKAFAERERRFGK